MSVNLNIAKQFLMLCIEPAQSENSKKTCALYFAVIKESIRL